jgi:signal transduction histidine kinase
MMEEQKRLNAAFAHDLRTPLTVLRGYTDFLKEYIPEGKISEEKLLSTLSTMSGHIERLERYSNTMKEINSFEELPIHPAQLNYPELITKMEEIIRFMDGKNGIAVRLINLRGEAPKEMYLDGSILMEVFENLMSNAIRYAVKEIRITLEIEEEENLLLLSVADDGKGFSAKGLTMAAKPYYTDSTENKSAHFGIGLYICKQLCEKHGGWLSVSNSMTQGAIITAAFQTKQL